MTAKQNPFKVFNIPISFKIDEIFLEKSFVEMQKVHHPDVNTCNVKKSLEISESYHTLKDDITRGEAIIKIFNINPDTFSMPRNFFSEILEITEKMQDISENDARTMVSQEMKKIATITTITKNNINDFTEAFIRYKYIKKAFINVYGS